MGNSGATSYGLLHYRLPWTPLTAFSMHHFLEALNGKGDLNKDKVITGTELGTYHEPRFLRPSGRPRPHYTAGLKAKENFYFFVRIN